VDIKKGDTVKVLSGKDKGKKEKVLEVDSHKGKIRVKNVMIAKKHMRKTKDFQGGIIEQPALISASKVMLVCPVCDKPTRASHKRGKNGQAVRICKKCSKEMDNKS
jgi:large subunit ribosomal protein L24